MKLKKGLPPDAAPLALLALMALVSALFLPGFNHMGMYITILTQAAFTGIMALGMLFVLICGDIDLSVGAQSALYGVVCAYLMKSAALPPVPSVLLTLLLAAAIGAANGWLIDRCALSPMIATIAVGVTLSGLTYIIGRGLPIFNLPAVLERVAATRLLGVPFSALLFAVLAALSALILRQTYWGKFFYAIGCDKDAAGQAGVPVRQTRVVAYVLCSLFCAVGAMVYVGRIGLALLSSGGTDILDVLTIAALAGVGFQGGRGRVLPVFCAALFLSALAAAFLALRVETYYQNVIKGAILFAAISTKMQKP